MNRRQLLASLAALPVVGRLLGKEEPPTPTVDLRDISKLEPAVVYGEPELRPCRCLGVRYRVADFMPVRHAVECGACRQRTPLCETRAEATRLWNNANLKSARETAREMGLS